MITLPVESMTATEMVAWCTSSPIYFSVFIEGAPFVGEDVTITTYSKRGALFMMRFHQLSSGTRKPSGFGCADCS
jgi:hypothetical protein